MTSSPEGPIAVKEVANTVDLGDREGLAGRGGPEIIGDEQSAPALSLIDEQIDVELPVGGRMVVVSDLHLAPVATQRSTAVADELTKLLDAWSGPGLFIIAGDGFELLAGPPDIDAILDSHEQLTEAASRFAAQEGRRIVVLSGNHDGQLAWDGEAAAVLTTRFGVDALALICDVHCTTEHGSQVVRVIHGNQVDQFNAFEDPWSPVDTPFGHHVVRDLLPELETRQRPGSLLEGVQWLDGDIGDFLGSRLFYRKIVGKLWLVAVPFVAILLLRLLTFLPGVGGLLHHHAVRWLLGFGILVVFMILVAAVAAAATLLRVNKALAETAVSARSDPASHNAPARADAARAWRLRASLDSSPVIPMNRSCRSLVRASTPTLAAAQHQWWGDAPGFDFPSPTFLSTGSPMWS